MITEKDGALLVDVKTVPRSPREALQTRGEELLVRVNAPPVEGEANAAVIELFAKTLGVPKRAVTLVKGETSKRKTLRIEGVTLEAFRKMMEEL
jgi:hypothetical protein